MEKAFLCPGCGASVILKDGPVEACCFCGAKLVEKDVKDRPEGGFYFGALDKASLSVGTCRQCGKKMYAPFGSEVKMASCLCCGSSDIVTETTETVLPKTLTFAPFSYTLSDAKEAYLNEIKTKKLKFHSFRSEEYLNAITPVYVPCFFYDYHVFANTILSVVPYVKQPRNLGDRVAGVLLLNDFTLERSSHVIAPYPKTFDGEMAWKNVAMCAGGKISRDKFDAISPWLSNGSTTDEMELSDVKKALLMSIGRPASEICEEFGTRIREFVKECIITENLDHFAISSYIDNTKYQPGLGQLIYMPVWMLKVRKKDQVLTWYMNGISGKTSELSWEFLQETPVKEEDSLAKVSKKRIRNYTLEDFGGPDRPINYRTYMVDTVASAFAAEMSLNEMSADKSLLHLERNIRKSKNVLEVPIVNQGYQADAEKLVEESRKQPLPSRPVPLPEQHSQLYLMKEEARKRSLGKGQKLPEKPLDRRVGNEEMFEGRDDSHESIAVEFGLSDIPEFDPTGPNPFKKNNLE